MNGEYNNDGAVEMPLWRTFAKSVIANGIEYGQKWDAAFFEEGLRENRQSIKFQFAMLSLRSYIESEAGYYIRACDNGNGFFVPEAPRHEDVAAGFDYRVKRYARRSVNLRLATLHNPAAQLTDCERSKMERNLEISSVRLALISRSKSAAGIIMKHKPVLLQNKVG